MPRFSPKNYAANLQLLDEYGAIAVEAGCTRAQLGLAWLLAKEPFVVPIPGTRNPSHVIENVAAPFFRLAPSLVARLDALINERTVAGARYNDATQQEIDTEEFDFSTGPLGPRP
jgi:aryl-alcohol dehydrogenase-like predicted oxidoreductase